jgi:GNAT superfamily N-acetyltransferase
MFKIRPATQADMNDVFRLINALALYEKAPDAVINTEAQLIEDGFGSNKVFDCLVATFDASVIGFALYFTGYSTWKGKTLYLEDFLVDEKYRGLGYGQLLFESVVNEAKLRKVKRMDWQVLDWNTPAIDFYKKNDAVLDPEWINGRLFFE